MKDKEPIEDLDDFIKKYDEDNPKREKTQPKIKETVQKEITLPYQESQLDPQARQILELQITNSTLKTQLDTLKIQLTQLRYTILFTGIFAIIAMILSIVL